GRRGQRVDRLGRGRQADPVVVLLVGGRVRGGGLDQGRQQVVAQDDGADGGRQEGVGDQRPDQDRRRPPDLADDQADGGQHGAARPPAAEDEARQAPAVSPACPVSNRVTHTTRTRRRRCWPRSFCRPSRRPWSFWRCPRGSTPTGRPTSGTRTSARTACITPARRPWPAPGRTTAAGTSAGRTTAVATTVSATAG